MSAEISIIKRRLAASSLLTVSAIAAVSLIDYINTGGIYPGDRYDNLWEAIKYSGVNGYFAEPLRDVALGSGLAGGFLAVRNAKSLQIGELAPSFAGLVFSILAYVPDLYRETPDSLLAMGSIALNFSTYAVSSFGAVIATAVYRVISEVAHGRS